MATMSHPFYSNSGTVDGYCVLCRTRIENGIHTAMDNSLPKILTVRLFSFMDQKEQVRKYLLRPQKMCKCVRYSANAYWETPEQHKERGEPLATEQQAEFALIELEPYPNNCEFFTRRADVFNFFDALRATIIGIEEVGTAWREKKYCDVPLSV
jgi:hypothetical protein